MQQRRRVRPKTLDPKRHQAATTSTAPLNTKPAAQPVSNATKRAAARADPRPQTPFACSAPFCQRNPHGTTDAHTPFSASSAWKPARSSSGPATRRGGIGGGRACGSTGGGARGALAAAGSTGRAQGAGSGAAVAAGAPMSASENDTSSSASAAPGVAPWIASATAAHSTAVKRDSASACM
jgi:hypothetical protein